MSREAEAVFRRYDCGKCGAKRGDACRTRAGRRCRDAHADRYRKALASDAFPVSSQASASRPVCPLHGLPDCSPLLNGCNRLVASAGSAPSGGEGS